MRLAALFALLLGLAADLLLRHVPWGLNALLWTALFVAAVVVLLRRERPQPVAAVALPCIAALLAAGGMVWRDAETLIALDVLVLFGSLAMLSLAPRGVKAWAAGLTRIAVALLTTAAQGVLGFFQLFFKDVGWNMIPRGSGSRAVGIVIRGLLLAAPALLLFGALLSSADETFAKLLGDLYDLDIEEAAAHIVVTLFVMAVTGGFLRSILRGGPAPWGERPAYVHIGAPEMNIALGLINVLFALFVAVQFRHFFGASALSHSEQARRGFFELVWVVTLVLPLLLGAEWLVANRPLLTRVLIGLQIALVFVIAASAYRRMQLYREAFGLTELRFYTTAFMIWVAVLLVWFCATVLTGHRDQFAIGVLVSAAIAVVLLHAVNPDETIVRTNLDRGARGVRPFDAVYAASLSDDAVPLLIANFDKLPPCAVMLLEQRESIGFRTWNLSRVAARNARQTKTAEIQRAFDICIASRQQQRQESKATPPMTR